MGHSAFFAIRNIFGPRGRISGDGMIMAANNPMGAESPFKNEEYMRRRFWRTLILIGAVALATFANAQTSNEKNGEPANAFSVSPSEYSSGGQGYDDPTNAYDGNLATASSASVAYGNIGSKGAIETWYGFPNAPAGATGMQLNVSSSESTTQGGSAWVEYSVDGGTTFQYMLEVIGCCGTVPQHTIYEPLSDSQDLTKVQVKVEVIASSNGHFASTASQSVYEIWISGTD